ncbi:hypothetical protein J0S82_005068 [Galemys pyrenaicus]|uniref:Uncharacterized protein n=1 Tax=Galemys pyrenaicus TaxID=202257 RepID=A0A8J5ZTA1_GALPY|nr:hypothetical protein J0S82_005068 [Galemys pyrenaicus]
MQIRDQGRPLWHHSGAAGGCAQA